MKKTTFVLFLAGTVLTTLGIQPVSAGKVETLIEKLDEKGILTQSEAKQLVTEMEKEEANEEPQVTYMAEAAGRKEAKLIELPKWVEKMKVKGDFRFRFQTQDRDGDGKDRRDRWRFRLRVGAVTDVNKQWKAGFGLATGGDDPRSTNQTMDDTFSSKGVVIDYAFAQYTPSEWLTAFGGKFKNPLWRPKDLMWDTDIRPEGIAAPLKFDLRSDLKLFITPAFFVLDEFSGTKDDPYMYVTQAGIGWKITDRVSLKVAAAYYGFEHLKGNSFTYSSGSNSTDAGGKLLFDYDSINLDAEVGFKLDVLVPYAAVFGQYVKADTNDDDMGYLIGLKFGDKKVKEFGQWGFKYNYRHLEMDAWPDFLPDSDFYGGETNSKGHEFEFILGLAKHVTFGIDYYRTENINGPKAEEDVAQFDLLLKW
jgi:polyhydroxyalkanoate synthesis regulator phasin